MAKVLDNPRPTLKERAGQIGAQVQGSQAWNAIFRPGSIFRKGYTDSPRNRSYVVMNSLLYHLHPVKVKRHAVKVSYTLCLGGLSFFTFILLTVPGIFLSAVSFPSGISGFGMLPFTQGLCWSFKKTLLLFGSSRNCPQHSFFNSKMSESEWLYNS